MVTGIAIALIMFGFLQILMGIATILGKFDPLLPKERKRLSAKFRKRARLLNAISMIVTSLIFWLLSAGLLLNIETLLTISAILMVSFIAVMLIVSLQLEAKYLR